MNVNLGIALEQNAIEGNRFATPTVANEDNANWRCPGGIVIVDVKVRKSLVNPSDIGRILWIPFLVTPAQHVVKVQGEGDGSLQRLIEMSEIAQLHNPFQRRQLTIFRVVGCQN